MKRITVHRALSELKLIDSKVFKKVEAMTPSAHYVKGGSIDGVSVADFEKKVKSDMDSVMALLKNKNALKQAIVQSNAKTFIVVSGEQMSVAEAITRKSYLGLERNLIQNLRAKHNSVKASANRMNAAVDQNLDTILQAAVGSSDNTKKDSTTVETISKSYREMNERFISDPLSVDALADSLEAKADAFEAEVDAILSESNAITLVEVPE